MFRLKAVSFTVVLEMFGHRIWSENERGWEVSPLVVAPAHSRSRAVSRQAVNVTKHRDSTTSLGRLL